MEAPIIYGAMARGYNALMSTRTAPYLDAIEHLPNGATLVIQNVAWDDYESLVEELIDRPNLRVSYDRGKLEIMSPLPEHEIDARIIDSIARIYSEHLDLKLENYGSTTWKRRLLERGLEPDSCYYVANADRIIGKSHHIDLETDPPPDICVEVDITNESFSKFSIYAALGVPEIWRYEGDGVHFYEFVSGAYQEIAQSSCLHGLKPAMLATALEQSKTEGQTAALRAFREQLTKER